MVFPLSRPHKPRPVPVSDSKETDCRDFAATGGTTAATARPCRVMMVVRPAAAAERIAGSCCRASSAPLVTGLIVAFMLELYGSYTLLSNNDG
jgi:hypothetical protein